MAADSSQDTIPDDGGDTGNLLAAALPPLCRRLALAGLCLCLISLVLALLPAMDLRLVEWHAMLRGGPLLTSAWIAFSSCSTYALTVAVAFLFVAACYCVPLAGFRTATLASGVIFICGVTFIDFVVKPLVARPRPWVHHPQLATVYHATGYSFPSGHSFIAWSMILPLAIALLLPGGRRQHALGIALIVCAILVMMSRLVLGVHYPSDVLFSAGLVWIAAPFVLLELERLRVGGRLTPTRERLLASALILFGVLEQFFNRFLTAFASSVQLHESRTGGRRS